MAISKIIDVVAPPRELDLSELALVTGGAGITAQVTAAEARGAASQVEKKRKQEQDRVADLLAAVEDARDDQVAKTPRAAADPTHDAKEPRSAADPAVAKTPRAAADPTHDAKPPRDPSDAINGKRPIADTLSEVKRGARK
jgi:hypothetical protein